MHVAASGQAFPRNVARADARRINAEGELATRIYRRASLAPFPFTAIVGQDDMKLAFVIAAIDPSIGGVLVFGDRGTGKVDGGARAGAPAAAHARGRRLRL